ncbi:MAG: M28 family peptidase, partial [Ignavibacteriales bacterium]
MKIIFLFIITFAGLTFPQGISKENLIKHIFTLGSDEFEGRGTGQWGGEKAAKYLAEEFRQLNIIPAGDDSSYFQNIRLHGGKPLNGSELIFYSGEEKREFNLWEDYLLYFSGEQTFIPARLDFVFAGYGIIAPEYDYNDYQTINAEGKIVVFLDGEPLSDDELYFDGERPTVHSYPDAKQRIALSRGARGSILIPDLKDGFYSGWEKLKNEFSFEDITLAYSVTNSLALLFNPANAEILFNASGYSLNDIYDMHSKGNLKSFEMNCGLSFKGEFKERDFISSNIIGMVEGINPELKDEYIIISAHYDHLGIGIPVEGDSIYNGVFDNAAGVSVLLEIARLFSENENKPERSIIFILTTAEEKGLLGSVFYTDNPVVPLYKTVANINMDGIALYDNFKSIIGVGSEYSTLDNFLLEAADFNEVSVTSIPSEFRGYDAFLRSDQVAFANAGIPTILIIDAPDYVNISREEGLKKFMHYSENIYHTPFDDLNQYMNFDAAVQH